jgi:hypothetical protein
MSATLNSVRRHASSDALNRLREAMIAQTRLDNQADNVTIGGRYLCHLEAYPRQLWYPYIVQVAGNDLSALIDRIFHDFEEIGMEVAYVLDTKSDTLVTFVGDAHYQPTKHPSVIRYIRGLWMGSAPDRRIHEWRCECPSTLLFDSERPEAWKPS